MYSDYAPATRAAAVSAAAQRVTNAYKRVRAAKAACEKASKALAINADYEDRMFGHAEDPGFTEVRAELMRQSTYARREWDAAVEELMGACDELEKLQTQEGGSA